MQLDTTRRSVDLVVVGGGIVGTATARELLRRRPGASIVLVEKQQRVGLHQTGHNSGVIHSGIYYPPGTLKADFCRRGLPATKQFARSRGVPVLECGKLLVATDAVELDRLGTLSARAGRQRLTIEELDAAQLGALEPSVRGLGAILVRETAVTDYRRITTALADEFVEQGGRVGYGSQVVGIEEGDHDVRIELPGRVLSARQAVFCAGLQSDRLAAMAGLRTDLRIVPFRGEYYTVRPARSDLIRHLVYPVPDPALPFLGVHLSPTVDGELTVGPNAVLGLSREGYRKGSVDLRDVAELVTFPGLWRTGRQHLRTGLRELYDSAVKPGYLAQVRKYAPSLRAADLIPRAAGIRAQAVLADGTLLHDFRIEQTPRTVHVLNAPSPAATAALPIAEHLADLLDHSPGA